MNEHDDRQVEDWLKAAAPAPAPASSDLRSRIADDLTVQGRSNRRIKSRIAWALTAAACLVLGASLWWINLPAQAPPPMAEILTAEHDPILDLPPTAWGYQVALSHSEADLDRLLDFHGEQYCPKPSPVTIASLLNE